ncbi:AsmA family protein [Stappia indica]|uniref:AsmA family protein n=1 Tax=Stappia indica TaxID=538381 RepID=UPI001146AAFA|nr:hypothetical protein [Stappia indica]
MKRLLAILLAALVLVAVAGIAGYLMIAREVSRERVEASLSARLGGAVQLTGTPAVSFAQGPALMLGEVRWQGRDGRWILAAERMSAGIDPAGLFLGEVRLSSFQLQGARLHLAGVPAEGALAGLGRDLSQLMGVPVSVAGDAISWGASEAPRLGAFTLRLSPSGEGGSLRGSVVAGDQTVEFSTTLADRGILTGTASGPVAVSVVSPLASFRMTGAVRNPEAARIEGNFDFNTSDLRGLAVRFGKTLVGEASFGALRITGDGALDFSRLVLDTARLELDGNVGEGRLGFELGSQRPRLEGTLAFEQFDLSAYLGELGSLAGVPDDTPQGDSLRDRPLSALLQAADIDLRLSANRFIAGPLSGGPSAIALLLRDGDLSLDLSETAVSGGKLEATARLKPAGDDMFDLAANAIAEKLDVRGLPSPDVVTLPQAGALTFRLGRTGKGPTLAAILEGAGGEVQLTLENATYPAGGEALARLASSTGEAGATAATSLVLDRLTGRGGMEGHEMRLSDVEALAGKHLVRLAGRLSLADFSLSLRGRLLPRPAATPAGTPAPEEPAEPQGADQGIPVLVRGTLARPSLLPDMTGVRAP